MELKLSCVCCGGAEFKETIIDGLITVNGTEYLHNVDIKNNKVVCDKCGLEDYIENLIIKIYE